MAKDYLDELLRQYKNGEISHENMLAAVRKQPYIDMGFAKIDTHRKLRVGVPEVIYGAGKTKEQIYEIALKLIESGEKGVLITRMDSEKADYVTKKLGEYKTRYDSVSGVCIIGESDAPKGNGKIVIVSAGTSDMAVAEEAAITAAALGNEVLRIYDAGVAGLHRLLDHMDEIMEANVVIAVAGMEGALASVVGGLVTCPVIAVPTSVGYGANFGGLSALLAMLNSCACGVSVVNIDNGFGAAYQASLINHMGRNDNENNVF